MSRIVKPRTRNQQRAIRENRLARPDQVTVIIAPDAGLPTSSWWTEARSREEFDARAKDEQRRLQQSRFGNVRRTAILD